METEHPEKIEEIQSWAKLPENTKWKRRKERVMGSWIMSWPTLIIILMIGVFWAGFTLGRYRFNPFIRDGLLVQGACGWENTSVKFPEVSGAIQYFYSCTRVAQ